jgi:peroxiredoxin
MQSKFLESDSFCAKRILLFGINRIQSHPTIDHVKQIDEMREQFFACGIDEIWFVSICDFLLFDPLISRLSPHLNAVQLTNADEITALQTILSKKGHHRFLKEYWQFAAVVNAGQVEYYIEQPFTAKFGPDTRVNIYGEISPDTVLAWLTNKST